MGRDQDWKTPSGLRIGVEKNRAGESGFRSVAGLFLTDGGVADAELNRLRQRHLVKAKYAAQARIQLDVQRAGSICCVTASR